jgi:hypothetical protein
MFRVGWLSSLLKTSSSRKDRRLAARNRKPIRLLLESLEERLTPSGLQTAGSYTDLVKAIAADTASNTNYVIQISRSFQFNSGGQVSISKLGSGSTLTLEGQNGASFTLTGNGNRLFTIGSGQNVSFENLTLSGGSVTNSKGNAQGGAILDQGGNVRLSKVIVQGNTVKGKTAEGGGVYASGAGALAIRDSILRDNSAQGVQGANATIAGATGAAGGAAYGGGLYVGGSGWTVTLIGDTLSGNTTIGGNGGNGAAGRNATAPNTSGGYGGLGGSGGIAEGGAAFFSVPYGSPDRGKLTILNDPSAPTIYPSIMIANSAQGGKGGNGGVGGTSTGTAGDAYGGSAGVGGQAAGGALYINENGSPTSSATIGNTTLYANKAAGGNDGAVGASGTGGRPNPPPPPPQPQFSSAAGEAFGGGLAFFANYGTITIVNSTVAENTAIGGTGYNGEGFVQGGGIYYAEGYNVANTLDNSTITQNRIDGGGYKLMPTPPPTQGGSIGAITSLFVHSDGSGVFVGSASASTALINNVIQNNRSINYPASDLDLSSGTLSNASNNFIGAMSPNAVSTSTNTVGNTQVQLGKAVGVDANGNPTGGPIYYPLLSGVGSIGAGSTRVLDTIVSVEGTTSANATDEIGNPRSSNGTINLGTVQTVTPISSYALVVTYAPASQAVYPGGPVSFTVSANGNPTPTVQWQVSSNGGITWSNISGATSTTLTLDNVTDAMNDNEYQAVLTNSSGSAASAVATLTVNAPSAPVITGYPSNQIVTTGQTAVFTASATGGPPPTVQWQVSSDGGKTWTNISGATSMALMLDDVTAAMNGNEYHAVFTNIGGSTVSSAASLIVEAVPPPPPVLSVPPLLAFLDNLFGGTETINADGTETITDSIFGIPVLVSTFDAQGHLVSVTLFGFTIPNWIWSEEVDIG